MAHDELITLAMRYEEAGDYEQAIHILRHGEAQYPGSDRIQNLLGIAYRATGNDTLAASCYPRL